MFVGFDTETHLITLAEPTPPLVCASFDWGDDNELCHHKDPDLEQLMEELLRGHRLIGFHICYDLGIIGNKWPRLIPHIFRAFRDGRIHDVRMRHNMIAIACGKRVNPKLNLGMLAEMYGMEIDKEDPWRKRYAELSDVPIEHWPKPARDYALKDAWAPREIFFLQEKERFAQYDGRGIDFGGGAREIDLFQDEANQMRAEWALALQSWFGICTRQEAVRALDESLAKEFERVKRRLQKAKLVRADGSRDIKATSALAGKSGMKVITSRGFSLDRKRIGDLDLPDDHPLNLYCRYGSIMTTRSRLLTKLKSPLLRTRYEPLVVTGRCSASNPPVQQFPREGGYRETLGPEEGNLWIVSDYKGAELITHGQNCIDLFPSTRVRLAEILNAGEDPHGYLAADVMKVPYKEFMRLLKKGDPAAKQMRQGAKPGSFGFPVGMGLERYCEYAKDNYGVKTTLVEAKHSKQLWLRRYPENKLYFKLFKGKFRNRRRIVIEQKWSGRWRGGCSYTEGCNTLFQGRAADGGKLALWRVAWEQWMEPDSDLCGTDSVLFVHDEIVIESPEDQARDAQRALNRVMIDAFEEVCPDMKVRVDSVISDRYVKP